MKKSILVLAVSSLLISGAGLSSCSSPAEKVENAEGEVTEAKEDLKEAKEDYLLEVETFRKETAEKVALNNQSIAEFKARKALDKKEAKAEYDKKVKALEQKNTDMQKRLDDYQIDGKDNWEKFKIEYNHDMDELGKAFKDLTVKNVK